MNVFRILPDADQPVSVEIKMADGVFIKSMLIKERGHIVPQHAHTYDHVSMLAVGSLLVWAGEDFMGKFVAPHGILIRANVKHRFQALEAGTLVYCIHRIDRTGEVEIAEEHVMMGEA